MIGNNPLASLPSYDETALCSAAFRVMRTMVNDWLRDVAINQSVFSDIQMIHFHRWVRSPQSLLYDPALRRNLNNLMRKMFLQIVAEFQRLGSNIIYADFNRIILNTGKKTITDAIGYVDCIVQSIRNRELFHSINLTYQQCWEFLIWMDTANYSGPRGKVPKELLQSSDVTQSSEMNITETDNVEIEMNWNIAEQLPEEGQCRADFDTITETFMNMMVNNSNAAENVSRLGIKTYEIVQRLHKHCAPGKESPGLYFCNAVCKVLSIINGVDSEVINYQLISFDYVLSNR